MKEAERELRQELEDRLRFETLLTEISALLINLPSDQIGSWIEEAQRRICEFLHFDLSALWQWSAEAPEVLTLTHLYTVPGGPSRPEQLNAYEAFPWVTQQISDGDLLTISTEHLGPEAAVDQQSLRYYGVKSSIVIPLSVGGGKPIGVVSFDTLHDERNSPPEIVKRLTLVAQIFSNALSRMESDRMLRQSEARLSLAADSAGAGLWELDFDSNLFWATERAKKIFGYNPKEIISLERFEKSVHPDDLDAVRQVITLAFERLEPFKIEYRVLVGDRSMKWIYSCGRPSVDAAGQPTGLLGASIDISKRKQAENVLKKTEVRLRNNQRDLQRLAGRLISVKEQELRRLSRELHDDLTQRLAVIAIEAGKMELRLRQIEHNLPGDPVRDISLIKEQLISVSEDVHRISRQLHPAILNDLGLVRAIESECTTLQLRENIDIVFREQQVPDHISDDISLCLYRIVQEGLKNVISHSRAKRCEVILTTAGRTLCLKVKDDGVGFDFSSVRHMAGLGLSSMRERVQLVRGDFSIDSRPGLGTAICVTIPL